MGHADGVVGRGDRPTVALATSAGVDDPDLVLLADALEQRGVRAVQAMWDDPSAEWAAYDLVVVRATWDYVGRRDQWLAWAEDVAARTRIENPPQVLRWSTDKRYLRELSEAGLPVVPTVVVPAGASADVRAEALASAGGVDEVVVKPVDGAGSRGVLRAAADDSRMADHLAGLLAGGRDALVQPYLSAVDVVGERAVVYLDGECSHALTKGPLLPSGALAVEGDALFAEERMDRAELTAAERAVADRTMAWVTERLGRLLYARVDLLDDQDGQPLVLEVELAEPSLFHVQVPESAETFADAIVRRLPTVRRSAAGPAASPSI